MTNAKGAINRGAGRLAGRLLALVTALICLNAPAIADEVETVNPSATQTSEEGANPSSATQTTSSTPATTAIAPSRAASEDDVAELDEVKVVSAAGYEQNIADAPASVFVITREELEKKSFNDLTEILKNVPGVFIEGGAVFKDISIRGMSSAYTLYLVDGKPLTSNEAHSPNGMAGGVATNALPPVSMIERIEIVRGPMSSLYGSEAMGGVINIITKKTPSEWSGTVKGEYTKTLNKISQDGYLASANLAGPIIPNLLSLQTYGSILGVDEGHCPDLTKDCGDKSSSPAPRFTSRQFGAKATLAINKANSVWLNYDYAKQEKHEEANVSYSTDTGSNRVNGVALKQTVGAGYDLNLDSFKLNSYLQRASTKNPTRGKGIDYFVTTANAQGTYFFDTNALALGAQYREEKLDDRATNAMPGNPPVVMKRWSYAVFAEDEWNILDNLAFTLGVRLNEDENFGSHVDPRVYLVYNINDEFTLKGGASSAYKAPTLRQAADDFGGVSGGGMAGNTVMMMGNPDVDPESSVSYEAAIAYSNREIGFNSSLTAYHTDYKDKIQSSPVCSIPAPAPMSCIYQGVAYRTINTYENVDKAVLEGVEATLNYVPIDMLSFGASYTYTDTEQKSGVNKGEPLNSISKHMYSANVDIKPTEKFSLWGQYTYKGAYKESSTISAVNSSRNKSYSLVDIGAVYQLKDNLKALAGVYNVANTKMDFQSHGKAIEGRRVTIGFVSDF
ncbi:MAG: TonB-dependent receptor [Helicobacteraceae bacterium]|jgi:outer membrane receptor for ferrienterochelin and colicins|nr:TonB-dependent receptor [Helicobacteraceae bacterium]